MKRRKQIAALPFRRNKRGKMEVLLVTSRDSGRWLAPKGWTMPGKKPWRAAEIEALEEAGVVGDIARDKIGNYRYVKRLSGNVRVPCKVAVYPMHVQKLKKNWPERDQRRRKWFKLKKAARLVHEPELKGILRSLRKEMLRANANVPNTDNSTIADCRETCFWIYLKVIPDKWHLPICQHFQRLIPEITKSSNAGQ